MPSSSVKFIPMNGAILFEEFTPKSESRIFLPDSAKKSREETYGRVVRVSDGWVNVMGVEMSHKLSSGDLFLPPRTYLAWKDDAGNKMGMCDEKDVIAKVEIPTASGAN